MDTIERRKAISHALTLLSQEPTRQASISSHRYATTTKEAGREEGDQTTRFDAT
jgi:hypothetical protein